MDGYIDSLRTDFGNRVRDTQNPALQSWEAQCRLNGLSCMIGQIKPDDYEKVELVKRMRASFMTAYNHLPKLVASLNELVY